MLSRRGVLAGAAASVAAAGITRAADVNARPTTRSNGDRVPFRGRHQAGIATPQQQHALVTAWDVTARDAAALAGALDRWMAAADRLTAGLSAAADSSEATGLGAARLTLTVGFAPTFFSRPGLGRARPVALVELPSFKGDRLDLRWCGGDVVVQACADDPQVAHHAIRTLARLGHRSLRPRWMQSGFLPGMRDDTARNLFGFADGTANIRGSDTAAMSRHVWVGDDDAPWMRDGSYLVVRRIRMRLEAWDASPVHEQEAAIGRRKASGARLVTARGGHANLARPEHNGGTRLLRRGYAFSEGFDAAGHLDAGLLFLAYQRDPGAQFTRLQRRLAAHDDMNEYVVHVGSGVFACPPGLSASGSWGDVVRHSGSS